ncbi:N-acetyltransferase [Sphingomonas sp. HITSZ_GF]|uniref:GNAT family N-acetyltransferase n=1 Tax=Sphingomonas sp. HITSZ_GF TaxID=3037247 RepID=UPI00240E5240|nr:N-acetyltransferase [Sphingomonas sp. HITSZ_GF]MDG2533119.1 N-acetyltransferase [Sphingomonas sp. HITSZ_GF]
MIALLPLETVDPQAVETLLDRAFGPGRRARTAYKVRLGTSAIPELSFAAVAEDGSLLGSIQCWPVSLECDGGGAVPMVMVGPVAVQPDRQQGGIGRMLMERMLEAAQGSPLPGADSLMLIGDPEYYGRFFDFTAEKTGGWRLPGPFESRRLLARGAGVPAGPGMVGARLRRAA